MADIELSIGPGVAGGLQVRVLASAAGEAASLARLDVARLLAGQSELQRAVMLSGIRTRRVLSQEEQLVQRTGRELFAALLGSGEVGHRYRASASMAAGREERLRIVLRADRPELAGLPWETMYDEAAGGYVCRSNQLVRRVDVPAPVRPLAVSSPLRILGVVSAPRGVAQLDVRREQDLLTQALAGVSRPGAVQLRWAPAASWPALHHVLLDGPWHVLHFIGHGGFDYLRDEGVVMLTGRDGRAELVTASQLVDLLGQANPVPRLVVLNSCSGGATGTADLFSGTAAALVRGGVSAVTAMQYEISDSAAAEFCRGFYAALAHGRGVDEAVSSGRVEILGLNPQTLEWLTPVLYLRSHDSRLFALDASTPLSAVPRPAGREAGRTAPTGSLRLLAGHTGKGPYSGVYGVAFSPDGALLASAGGDNTARIWDAATGAPIRTLTGHKGYIALAGGVLAVQFSPDGAVLASGGGDGTVRIWDTRSWAEIRAMAFSRAVVGKEVVGLAFSPDGRLLACAVADGSVRICEARSWAEIRTLAHRTANGAAAPVNAVTFSPDGAVLASDGNDGLIRVWDPVAGTQVATLSGRKGLSVGVSQIAFSPDGAWLARAGHDKVVQILDAVTGAEVRAFKGHTGTAHKVAFSPDGALLASAGKDRIVRIWDAVTGAEVRTLGGHAGAIWAVAFSPDGIQLASAGKDQVVRLWSL